MLKGFLGGFGRAFYGVPESKERIVLSKEEHVVKASFVGEGVEVVPFRAGRETWSVRWV